MIESSLVIGCKTCAELYKKTHENNLVENYFPFPFTTAYKEIDLNELTHFYTCPYCENALYLSPNIQDFIKTNFNAAYHVHIHENILEIITESISLTIPINQAELVLKNIVEKLGMTELMKTSDEFPELKEIKKFQKAAMEIDPKKWIMQLKTNQVIESYISSDDLWFGGY